jgi:hypothetical protein
VVGQPMPTGASPLHFSTASALVVAALVLVRWEQPGALVRMGDVDVHRLSALRRRHRRGILRRNLCTRVDGAGVDVAAGRAFTITCQAGIRHAAAL